MAGWAKIMHKETEWEHIKRITRNDPHFVSMVDMPKPSLKECEYCNSANKHDALNCHSCGAPFRVNSTTNFSKALIIAKKTGLKPGRI